MRNMTSISTTKLPEKWTGNRTGNQALGMKLHCFGRAIQNGGPFHMSSPPPTYKRKAELLPKNIARTVQEYKSTNDTWYLKKICRTLKFLLSPEHAKRQAIEDRNLTSLVFKIGVILNE